MNTKTTYTRNKSNYTIFVTFEENTLGLKNQHNVFGIRTHWFLFGFLTAQELVSFGNLFENFLCNVEKKCLIITSIKSSELKQTKFFFIAKIANSTFMVSEIIIDQDSVLKLNQNKIFDLLSPQGSCQDGISVPFWNKLSL